MTRRQGPMMAMRTEVRKAKDFKGTVGRLVRFTRPYAFTMIAVVIMAILGTLFGILAPKLIGNITTLLSVGVLSNGQTPLDLTAVHSILITLVFLYGLSALFQYLQVRTMIRVTQQITHTLRSRIIAKINTLPLRFFDHQPIGDVLSRITYDVDTIGQSFQQSISQVITALTSVVGILVMMLTISWEMTLIALVSLPISLFLVTNIVKIGQRYFRQRTKTLGLLNSHIEETFGVHPIIKVFNAEDRQIAAFEKLSQRYFMDSWKSEFIAGVMMPLISLVSNLSYVAVSVIGAYLVLNGQLQIGGIQAFITYTRNFNQPINQVANIGTLLQSTVASAERVFEFLDEAEESAEASGQAPHPLVGQVTFDHVRFGYSAEHPFIKDLSFTVKPGQRVAIVGPTGAGKTTLINLLMRFYDVHDGAICVDGIDVRTLSRHQLRTIFGMVLQDTWLFNDTITANIRFAQTHCTDDQVLHAAKAAMVDHFVRTLPEGYDTLINEEANNLSQGQKQLLTIARAFLADHPILILDEATSSVDTRTEVLIRKAMERLMANKTSFIIAHRLSTIRDADLILVMNHGAIIEQGTHVSLMAQNGFYTTLYNAQFEPEDEASR
jgi:ATP-binding cassette, subfamily B, multidrug efflux pump